MRITAENARQQLRLREPEALSFLIDQHRVFMTALAMQILAGIGTAEDAEECVTDVFIQVWNAPDHYDPSRGTWRTWLLVLTKYRALDLRRRLTRERPRDVEGPVNADPVVWQVVSRENQEELVACIEQLDSGVREVMIRRYLLGLSIADIMKVLGLPRSTVDNRLSRGRQQLRQRWLDRQRGGESIDDA